MKYVATENALAHSGLLEDVCSQWEILLTDVKYSNLVLKWELLETLVNVEKLVKLLMKFVRKMLEKIMEVAYQQLLVILFRPNRAEMEAR